MRQAGSLLLGVDIGTSSSKGVLCAPDGSILAQAAIPHATSFPRPGWAEHDADAIWWGELVGITRQLLSGDYRGADVGAVAVSAIGPCMLPLDARGRPLRPGVLYGIDSRAMAEIAWLEDRYGAEAMFARNGMALTAQAVGPKILWLRRHEPNIFAQTTIIHSASDYMVYRLTGEHVIDRHTASYFVPMFDVRRLDWDTTFGGEIIGLDRLPRLLDASEIAGSVTAAAAEETGLVAGTPVTVGTIDAAAEAISVGVVDPGDMMVMYGSTLFLINLVPGPTPDPRMWTAAYCLPGRHAVTGSLTTAGLLLQWFRDELGGPEVAAERDGGEAAWAALARLAAAVDPGSDGLLCLPYFAGERTPLNDPDARGMFAGLSLRHSRAHLYRAVLEGIGHGFRQNLAVMAEMGATPGRLVAVGGGTQNPLWLEVMSDISGMPQALPETTVGAAYGDALLAGLATGIVPGLEAMRETWVRTRAVIEPNPALAAMYDAHHEVFSRLYPATKHDIHRLNPDRRPDR
jgi:xylulokinase